MRNFTFKKDDDRWFIVLPEWEGDKEDLEMVMGADTMLDILSQDETSVNVRFSFEPCDNYKFELISIQEEFDGCTYQLISDDHIFNIWLCDVTKYIFGEYPKRIYIF